MSFEISGNRNKISDANPGNARPIKNHKKGLLPIRLAKRAVTNGMLKRKPKPIEKNIAAPINYKFT